MAALWLVLTAGDAAAQRYQPGFLDALARWLSGSAESLRDAKDALGEQAKDATRSVVRLPNTRIVSGRTRCEPAANGAPDCPAASDALCRSRGLHGGRSLDIETARECPVQTWSGAVAQRTGAQCQVTYVTRALCQ